MEKFRRPRAATIQFSDVFGDLPLGAQAAIPDFDAELTAQVRNTNRFNDAYFPIGIWPALGDYGAVLVEHLRAAQAASLKNLTNNSHPDTIVLKESMDSAVVVIVNSAPRRDDHHQEGQNGDDFYVGLTASGVEVYAQLPYFRGLQARNLLKELYRIPDDSGIWPVGEQFRSSCVTTVRSRPEVLESVSLTANCPIEGIGLDVRVAYADKFGNVRLEVKDIASLSNILVPGDKATLKIGPSAKLENVNVVQRLTDIPEDKLGLYFNPADDVMGHGPAYLELSRRVSDCNDIAADHAYITLLRQITDNPDSFDPNDWENTNISIETS